MKSYKELEVWQKSIDLVTEIYSITKDFPNEEKYGIISQIRRSAISVPANIAEGWGRNSTKEYIQFLYIARSSLLELETHFIISNNIKYINKIILNKIQKKIESIAMMLNRLISSLKNKEN